MCKHGQHVNRSRYEGVCVVHSAYIYSVNNNRRAAREKGRAGDWVFLLDLLFLEGGWGGWGGYEGLWRAAVLCEES